MSRRIPSVSDPNIRSEQAAKRFKSSQSPSSYRNIFEQFDDVTPSPTLTTNVDVRSKLAAFKLASQQSSSTSSLTARSIMTRRVTRESDELWSIMFQPKTRHDLVLHPRKVKELEDLLEKSCEIVKTNTVKRPPKLILISGPSGSGKSTCLRLLAASLDINVVEWETRTTSALTSTSLDEQRDDRQWIESQKRSFRTFVFQSTRYLSSSTGNGLLFDNDTDDSMNSSPGSSSTKQIVLVEDLPNGFYSDPSSFHSTLRELKRVAHHPIVFILTDNNSLSASNNPHLLFPLSIIDELRIEQISFNAIAPTYMKKALESIANQASLLKLKPASRDCIHEILQTANGDLRSAINALQFSSNGRVKSAVGTIASKDSCLSLFQGLGRILYKKDSDDTTTENHRKYPENLIEQCHISAPTFIGFLHENYLDFYSSIDDAAQLCDYLSITEHILKEWETRVQLTSTASSLACRAVRLCNTAPVSRGFKPMRKPQDNDMKTRAQKSRALLMTNKLYYGCSEEEYFATVLPYQAYLLKATRSSLTNATDRSIVDLGFIDRFSKKRYDSNSLVTEKNSSIALLADHTSAHVSDTPFNFSLMHTATNPFDKLEYDDDIDIDDASDD